MKLLTRLLPLALVSATALAADPAITGTWTVSGSVQSYPIRETCIITQTAAKLTGTCSGEGKTVTITDGKIDGKTVTFSHPGEYQGQDLTLTFTGDLNSTGGFSGSIDVQPLNVQGDFSATKADPKPAPAPAPPQ